MSSTNDMNDNESTSTFSSEGANSNRQQNLAGQPFNPVWDHFNQVEKKKKALSDVQLFYYKQLIENNEIQKSNKKQKVNPTNKKNILKYVKNQKLSSK
ncbi:17139_t:CDS:2 [Gigaspora margarita]|uniref:17139_t:CDS:1 n=1 Tax=Gigaspora margarita TaxID=4874 RepID=A0ABN7W8B6_GIGMA|nr:17139_t:CDS:2 [Gigaspora margarita]